MTDFKEGDTVFTVANVGFLLVPEPCGYGSAEDTDTEPCTKLGGFLIGVDCVEDEEGFQTAFVVCGEHLSDDLLVLADVRMKRERERAEAWSAVWRLRQSFLEAEVERADKPVIQFTLPDDYDMFEYVDDKDEAESRSCAHCQRPGLSVDGICDFCDKCDNPNCCQVVDPALLEDGWEDWEDCAHCGDLGSVDNEGVCVSCDKCNDPECCQVVEPQDDVAGDEVWEDQCYVYHDNVLRDKPWTVSCDCGYHSNHRSEDAADRKARKHIKENDNHISTVFRG